MGDWNEQAAPNNNLPASQMKYAQKQKDHEFAEELSDGGERDRIIKELRQAKKR